MAFFELTFSGSGGSLNISKGTSALGLSHKGGPGPIGFHSMMARPQTAEDYVSEPKDSVSLTEHTYKESYGSEQTLVKADNVRYSGGIMDWKHPQRPPDSVEDSYSDGQPHPTSDNFHEQMKKLQNQKSMHDFKTDCSNFFNDIK